MECHFDDSSSVVSIGSPLALSELYLGLASMSAHRLSIGNKHITELIAAEVD